MKSLNEILDKSIYECDSKGVFHPVDLTELICDSVEDVDRYYLPRPVFDNGEPVQIGDRFTCPDGRVTTVNYILYRENSFALNGFEYDYDDVVRRPLFDDSQEKIDQDEKLQPSDYCRKFGINSNEKYRAGVKYKDLFDRQRRLAKKYVEIKDSEIDDEEVEDLMISLGVVHS